MFSGVLHPRLKSWVALEINEIAHDFSRGNERDKRMKGKKLVRKYQEL